MSDNVAITAGSGTTVAADDVGGALHQRVKVTWGPDGTGNDADVASGKPLPVQVRSSAGTEATFNANGQAVMASSSPVVPASDWIARFSKAEDAASANGDEAIPAMAIQRAAPADTAADLDYSMLQMSGGALWTRQIPQANSASVTFTPAASAHSAGDCVGAAGNFASLGISGSNIMITSATLYIDNTAALATAWRVHLYNVTPSSAIADDAAWDFADADVAQYLGSFDLPSTATDIGTNQWAQIDGINKQVKLAGTGLFAYLVCLTGVTTTATAHIVTLNTVQL